MSVEDRLSKLCSLNATEDETNFILECPSCYGYKEALFLHDVGVQNDRLFIFVMKNSSEGWHHRVDFIELYCI